MNIELTAEQAELLAQCVEQTIDNMLDWESGEEDIENLKLADLLKALRGKQ